jgi:hypothetical protein
MARETVVSLAQFRLLKGKRRKSIAVQFTPTQWKRALEGISYSSGKPPAEFRGIRLVKTRGVGGGLAMPECPFPMSVSLSGRQVQVRVHRARRHRPAAGWRWQRFRVLHASG